MRRREKCSKGGRKERRNGKKGNDRGKMEGRVREKGGESGRKEGGGGELLILIKGFPQLHEGLSRPELIYLVRHHGKLGISEYQTLSNSILSVM